MNLSSFALKRPLSIIMITLGLMIMGVLSLSHLKMTLFPPINYPQITITTQYDGAGPQEVEKLITIPIEEAVSALSGVKSIESYSKEEKSIVILSFDWNSNLDESMMRVREGLDVMLDQLPKEAKHPVVIKLNPFDQPAMILNVSGLDANSMRKTSKKVIKTHLEKINGVAQVRVEGGVDQEVKVLVDLHRLEQLDYDLYQVIESIEKSNLNFPAGSISDDYNEYLVRVIGQLKDENDLYHVPIIASQEERQKLHQVQMQYASDPMHQSTEDYKAQNKSHLPSQRLVWVKDIAQIKRGFKKQTSSRRLNGQDSVQVLIFAQSGANLINVSDQVYQDLNKIKRMAGHQIKLDVIYDQADFMRQALHGVMQAGLMGGLMAFIILCLFLRQWRVAFIVGLVIPVSVLIIFICMHAFSLTLNLMSLGGIVLATGLLVDNSIVVIENLMRYYNQNKTSVKDLIKGTSEVSSALFSSTLTTIAVFLPIMFVSGIAKELFGDLAITVSLGLVISLVVALTLVPVLFKFFIRTYTLKNTKPFHLFSKDNIFSWKCRAAILAIVFVVISCLMWPLVKQEMMPRLTHDQYQINLSMPIDTNFKETKRITIEIEQWIKNTFNPKHVIVQVGSQVDDKEILNTLKKNEAQMLLIGVNLNEQDFILEWNTAKDSYGWPVKLNVSVFNPLLSNLQNDELEIIVQADDVNHLRKASNTLVKEIKERFDVSRVNHSLDDKLKELSLHVNRDAALSVGLNVSEVALLMRASIYGHVATHLKQDLDEIPVRVQIDSNEIKSLLDLNKIKVYSSQIKKPILLSQLVSQEPTQSQLEIYRLNQKKTAKVLVKASYKQQQRIKDVLNILEHDVSRDNESIDLSLGSLSKEHAQSFKQLVFALILALVFIYMIIAAQFESFSLPIIILMLTPLALCGGLWMLFLMNQSINIISLIGFVMLSGLVVNNGIVLIDFIHRYYKQGNDIITAINTAVDARFRPILMTTLTTVFGLLPLAFFAKEGAAMQSPMATVVIGGLIFSFVFTFLVISLMYVALKGR